MAERYLFTINKLYTKKRGIYKSKSNIRNKFGLNFKLKR